MGKAHSSERVTSVHVGNMQGTNLGSKDRASTQPFRVTVFTEIILVTTSEGDNFEILKFVFCSFLDSRQTMESSHKGIQIL